MVGLFSRRSALWIHQNLEFLLCASFGYRDEEIKPSSIEYRKSIFYEVTTKNFYNEIQSTMMRNRCCTEIRYRDERKHGIIFDGSMNDLLKIK